MRWLIFASALLGATAGAKIVDEYRENEKIAVDHHRDGRQREMRRLSSHGHGFDRARLGKNSKLVALRHFLRLKTV